MKFSFITLALFAISFSILSIANAVTFDWAAIGNPGNADDIHRAGFGGVDYRYRMSKHEVTNSQYTEFLNAVAADDPNSLYFTFMDLSSRGGITRSGSAGSYTYAVKADSIGNGPGGADGEDYSYGNKPVNYVSFLDAMRFTNWLENGQPSGAQNASTTEAGVYNISNGLDEVRNPSAKYFIPSEDEWYKAAYYDPNVGGGVYFDYPTGTETKPKNNLPSADTGNFANFKTGRFTTGNSLYPLTDVGAYTKSESPYGTFDQGGNVGEWNEKVFRSTFGSSRGIRGGSWDIGAGNFSAPRSLSSSPFVDSDVTGFRVASIPEPNTLLLGALACVGLLVCPRGRR